MALAQASPNPADLYARRLAANWRRLGEEIIRAKRADLSVPVQHTAGGVIRSKEGEHPRRETGNLRGAIESRVSREGDLVRMKFDCPVEYAGHLVERRRIIFQDIPDRFADDVREAAVAAVLG